MFDDDSQYTTSNRGYQYSRTYRYDSKCCGTRVHMSERGSGNDDWKLKGRALQPCGGAKLKHTTNVADVKYNGSNVVECKMNAAGTQCELKPLDMYRSSRSTPHFSCNGYDTYTAIAEVCCVRLLRWS